MLDARVGRIRRRTEESFAYEWKHFGRILPEYAQEARNYFGIVADRLLEDAVVLDAGCGTARWARHVAGCAVRRLYAVDFSRVIDQAAVVLAEQQNAHCVQADVCRLPFRSETFDFAYCLGVLHHLVEPDEGMRGVTRVLKENGALLVYLYYSLENRPRFFRWLLRVVSTVRRLTVWLPKPIMYVLRGSSRWRSTGRWRGSRLRSSGLGFGGSPRTFRSAITAALPSVSWPATPSTDSPRPSSDATRKRDQELAGPLRIRGRVFRLDTHWVGLATRPSPKPS